MYLDERDVLAIKGAGEVSPQIMPEWSLLT